MVIQDQFNLVIRGLVEAAGVPVVPKFATDISTYLLEKHSGHIHWRTIEAILRRARDYAKSTTQKGRWQFTPLKKAIDAVKGAGDTIQIIDPSRAVVATGFLHDVLASLSGLVRLCDPYLDQTSLQHLDAISTGTNLRILTFNITDTGTTRSLVNAFAIKKVAMEIRKAHAAILHDRYILTDDSVLILGTSLNGFGKKQCFVTRAGQSIAQSLITTFDSLWAKATPWP